MEAIQSTPPIFPFSQSPSPVEAEIFSFFFFLFAGGVGGGGGGRAQDREEGKRELVGYCGNPGLFSLLTKKIT